MVDTHAFFITLLVSTFVIRLVYTIVRTLIDAFEDGANKTNLYLGGDLLIWGATIILSILFYVGSL